MGFPSKAGCALPPRRERCRPSWMSTGARRRPSGTATSMNSRSSRRRGYAILFLNPRGSDGYSEAFADIRGHYGERDYQDLMEGVDFAAARYPFIDRKRLAIAGGSYGGFMTNWVVTQTDRFKAAVTDRSISSWWTFWGTSDIGPYFGR